MDLSYILVEDLEIDSEILLNFASKVPFLKLQNVFTDAIEAQKFIIANDIDLIISDIMLPGINGMQMMQTLQNPPQVIFTTYNRDFAVMGFDVQATDYLVKDFTFDRFLTAINRALDKKCLQISKFGHYSTNTPSGDFFFIQDCFSGSDVKIYYSDILYFESNQNYVFLATNSKTYKSHLTMNEIEQKMPVSNFVRVHRSFLVSIDRVDKIDKYQLTLNNKEIPISETYRKNLFEKFKQLHHKKMIFKSQSLIQ